jgi:hypothetical protein
MIGHDQPEAFRFDHAPAGNSSAIQIRICKMSLHELKDLKRSPALSTGLHFFYWKKVACGAFFRQQLRCRRQKA